MVLGSQAQEKDQSQAKPQAPTHLKYKPTKASEFKPHMLGHIYDGCPDNSECSEETGKLRKKWLSLISDKKLRKNNKLAALKFFKKKNGVPVGYWFIPQKVLPKEIIYWQSPCQHHNKKKEGEKKLIDLKDKIKISESFISTFQQLNDLKIKEERVFIPVTYTLNAQKQALPYYYPRGDLPTMVKNNKLYFVREDEGHYYSMTVDQKGRIDISQSFTPKEFPEEVKCPDSLLNLMKKKHEGLNLYQSYFCKAIWNQSKKSFQTFIFGWSCN